MVRRAMPVKVLLYLVLGMFLIGSSHRMIKVELRRVDPRSDIWNLLLKVTDFFLVIAGMAFVFIASFLV
jgi:hypothetical protein